MLWATMTTWASSAPVRSRKARRWASTSLASRWACTRLSSRQSYGNVSSPPPGPSWTAKCRRTQASVWEYPLIRIRPGRTATSGKSLDAVTGGPSAAGVNGCPAASGSRNAPSALSTGSPGAHNGPAGPSRTLPRSPGTRTTGCLTGQRMIPPTESNGTALRIATVMFRAPYSREDLWPAFSGDTVFG